MGRGGMRTLPESDRRTVQPPLIAPRKTAIRSPAFRPNCHEGALAPGGDDQKGNSPWVVGSPAWLTRQNGVGRVRRKPFDARAFARQAILAKPFLKADRQRVTKRLRFHGSAALNNSLSIDLLSIVNPNTRAYRAMFEATPVPFFGTAGRMGREPYPVGQRGRRRSPETGGSLETNHPTTH